MQARLYLEEKHEPMSLALVAALADESGQMKVAGPQAEPDFFRRLAAGAGVRRFAGRGVELAAARAPEAPVRLASAEEEQDFIAVIEAIEQRRNAVGKGCFHIGAAFKRRSVGGASQFPILYLV